MQRHSTLFFIALIIVLAGAGLYAKHICDQKHLSQTEPKATSLTEQVQKTQTVYVQRMQPVAMDFTQSYIGFVVPIHAVEIRPFISGFIDEVLVDGGQEVFADEPMFVLEQSQYIAQMDLQMSNIISTSADYENAKMYYDRLKAAGEKAVSESDLDAAQAKFLTAGAAVGAAVAQYDAAQVMYNYTFINAPITGVLGDLNATKGQYVSPESEPLAYLVQTTPMRVVFSISNATYLLEKEKNPDDLFALKTIRLKLADGRFYDISGKVQFLDNVVTAATSSVQVYADFDNVDRMLLPNAYVDVLVQENLPNALTIPQQFVEMTKEGYFVWIVDDMGRLQHRQITVADQVINQGFYLVLSGLKAGDFVVTQKPAKINADTPVQMKIEKTILPDLADTFEATAKSVNNLNGDVK